MRTLSFKDDVTLVGMQPEALEGIFACMDVFADYDLSMTLTSCRDGEHSPHSHHYKGLAWDIRVWEIQDIDAFCADLRTRLGKYYQVINESDHIHVEYDPETL